MCSLSWDRFSGNPADGLVTGLIGELPAKSLGLSLISLSLEFKYLEALLINDVDRNAGIL